MRSIHVLGPCVVISAFVTAPLSSQAAWTLLNPNNNTSQFLPGPGENRANPATWTVPNSNWDPNFTPRYYGYGEDTMIPIHNKADPDDPSSELYFNPILETWIGDEVAIAWNPDVLTYADPKDPGDSVLYPTNGLPVPVQIDISPEQGWIADDIYQKAAEYFHANRGPLDEMPMMIDGLLYTNNAIFSLVNRATNMRGRMVVNGALVAADLGMLTPGYPTSTAAANQSQLSGYSIGLQLNYDQRVRGLLNVTNPFRVQLKRTLWNPTANLF